MLAMLQRRMGCLQPTDEKSRIALMVSKENTKKVRGKIALLAGDQTIAVDFHFHE